MKYILFLFYFIYSFGFCEGQTFQRAFRAKSDPFQTKSFQLIVNYYANSNNTLNADTIEIPEIKVGQDSNMTSCYYIHEEDAEGGPYVLFEIYGHCNFTDKLGNKLCFSFRINSSSEREYSRISSSLNDCIVDGNQEYSFYTKGKLIDILKYKSPLINVMDKNRGIGLFLVIKE